MPDQPDPQTLQRAVEHLRAKRWDVQRASAAERWFVWPPTGTTFPAVVDDERLIRLAKQMGFSPEGEEAS